MRAAGREQPSRSERVRASRIPDTEKNPDDVLLDHREQRLSPNHAAGKRRRLPTTPVEEVRSLLRIRSRQEHVGRRSVPDMPEPPGRW